MLARCGIESLRIEPLQVFASSDANRFILLLIYYATVIIKYILMLALTSC